MCMWVPIEARRVSVIPRRTGDIDGCEMSDVDKKLNFGPLQEPQVL